MSIYNRKHFRIASKDLKETNDNAIVITKDEIKYYAVVAFIMSLAVVVMTICFDRRR